MTGSGGVHSIDQPAVLGARLREAREAAGLSLSGLASKVPYSRAALGHYETGARTPPADVIEWYERECGKFADSVTAISILGRADVDRRSFLRNATYSAALSATGLLGAGELARLASVESGRRADMREVRAVQAVTDAFVKLDESRGGGIGRTAVAEFLGTDVAALLNARFPDSNTRMHAFSAAAELAYLAGFKAHDAGQDGIAQRYFLAALRLAEDSGMPGHDAFVFRILALQGTDIQQNKFSVALAEQAERRARSKIGPDVMALFTVAVARCHAENGDARAAHAALRRAEPHIHAEMDEPPPRWVAMWCPNKATVIDQTAKTFQALSELRDAENHYQLGTSIWDPHTHARVFALTAAETGLIRWRMGNHDAAVAIWRSALPILHRVDSARTTKSFSKIRATAPELFADTDPSTVPKL
ncbi:helix-turn-helix transcriptional regulator [Nocardia sp. NBC_01730]|uniref:helix-turn-helix domain-containing protein n=1 Tax=Nocardia sp. NBC_01730 TaxID=2975998 RepID=UPI002E0FA114|nr:helix-turn-helix transcriptional regulator [Nocardia sp. NBC_01730]